MILAEIKKAKELIDNANSYKENNLPFVLDYVGYEEEKEEWERLEKEANVKVNEIAKMLDIHPCDVLSMVFDLKHAKKVLSDLGK